MALVIPGPAFHQTGICIAVIFITIIKNEGVGHETVWKVSTRNARYRDCGLGYRYMSGLSSGDNDLLTTVRE